MPNEEIFAKLESFCYLILLMDSLGLEINSGKVSEMWTKSFHQKELPAEFVELLVFFWSWAEKSSPGFQVALGREINVRINPYRIMDEIK